MTSHPRAAYPPTRRNVSLRTPFYEAAQDILSTDGYGALKLAAVCRRLQVTTGAFYHSFGSWQEFTDALLAHWRNERTTLMIEVIRRQSDPVTQLQVLAGAGSDLQHRAEAAIRVWAGVDPRVGEVQRQVDEERYGIVLEAMTALVGAEHADRFTKWGMSTLVGYEQLSDHYAREDLFWSLQQILEVAIRVRADDPDPPLTFSGP